MQNQNDYRQWPNILAINAKIEAMGLKLAKAIEPHEIMACRLEIARLNSQKYDQIQLNKIMFRTETERKAA